MLASGAAAIQGLFFLHLQLAAALPEAGAVAPPPPELPVVDPTSVVLFLDQGRMELRGTHLAGARLRWAATGGATATGAGAGAGEDTCREPARAGKGELCAFAVPRDLRADAVLLLLPPAAAAATSAAGSTSAPGAAAAMPLHAGRVVIDRLLPPASAVDLTNGIGHIPLAHPEAVASVECAQAACELTESAVIVRSISGAAANLTIRFRLAPHHFLQHGDATESLVVRAVSVLHCPAAVASGPPLRHADATRMVVRIDERCGHDARQLNWTVNGKPARVERAEKIGDSVYAQLAAGEIEETQATVIATRPEPDDVVIAVARVDTRPAPQPRSTLELPGFGKIGFLPTNRDALLRTAPAGDGAHLVPLPVEGAYRVTMDGALARVRGDESAGGLVSLRFGYRTDTLPAPFATTDLAIVAEPVQRPIREARVPAALGASVGGAAPLLELLCADGHGQAKPIAPGVRASIPFPQRESCRLVIHRERLRPEDGAQEISIDVSVTKVDDAPRPEAHVAERMTIRPGGEPRVFWIHGVKNQFDRIVVRVSHVIDEANDIAGAGGGGGGGAPHAGVTAAQWAVVVGQGHLRFYATAAIPTGLFRITAPSDVLTLNFGALSRLTWLDREGQEGLLGLEFGALGIGLAATPGFPRTLAVLTGLGVGVPIGNRGEQTQASVNLHAWLAYELRDQYHLNPADPRSPLARHLAFLFGPSITIGNVGTNL